MALFANHQMPPGHLVASFSVV